jgi:hypothetical protein
VNERVYYKKGCEQELQWGRERCRKLRSVSLNWTLGAEKEGMIICLPGSTGVSAFTYASRSDHGRTSRLALKSRFGVFVFPFLSFWGIGKLGLCVHHSRVRARVS